MAEEKQRKKRRRKGKEETRRRKEKGSVCLGKYVKKEIYGKAVKHGGKIALINSARINKRQINLYKRWNVIVR